MPHPQTRQLLARLLRAGHCIEVRWDCGHDESLVYTRVNGQQIDPSTDLALEVEEMLIDELDLPGAGDDSVTGAGRFFCQGTAVGLAYDPEQYVYWERQWDPLDEEAVEALAVAPPAGHDAADAETAATYPSRRILFETTDGP